MCGMVVNYCNSALEGYAFSKQLRRNGIQIPKCTLIFSLCVHSCQPGGFSSIQPPPVMVHRKFECPHSVTKKERRHSGWKENMFRLMLHFIFKAINMHLDLLLNHNKKETSLFLFGSLGFGGMIHSYQLAEPKCFTSALISLSVGHCHHSTSTPRLTKPLSTNRLTPSRLSKRLRPARLPFCPLRNLIPVQSGIFRLGSRPLEFH